MRASPSPSDQAEVFQPLGPPIRRDAYGEIVKDKVPEERWLPSKQHPGFWYSTRDGKLRGPPRAP